MNQRGKTLLRDIQAGHTARRVALLLLLLVSALAVISLVLLSPLMLAALNPNGNIDWQRLADIAQTYGAASAVLALLALGGVAISLLFQAREMRATRLQAMRATHMELMRMALENPTYLRAMGRNRYDNEEQEQQSLFVNLLIASWEMSYGMGGMNEVALRAAASKLFTGEAGLRYWKAIGERRMQRSLDKRTRRFHQIIDEEYRKATEPPAADQAPPAQAEPGSG